MKKFATLNLDFVGVLSAAICAVHCLAVPFLLAFGALGKNTHWVSHQFEMVFFITSLAIASFIILKNIIREKDKKDLVLFLIGLFFLTLSFSNHSHNTADIIYALIGGASLCLAHIRNWNHHQR